MIDWDADLYRRFEAERTRPARDLLAQVPIDAAERVVDLGCGPGNSTELLVRRFPGATVTGLDTSPAMLAAARQRLPETVFEQVDIAQWQAPEAVDLLFANAVLQWVGDHHRLLPRLLVQLRPGGILAVQVPDNLDEPSHRLMRDIAGAAPFAQAFEGSGPLRREAVLSAADTYDLLAPHAASVDVWRTVYNHPMPSAAAIVEWVRSTGLRPFLDVLPERSHGPFLAAYTDGIEAAYPARGDGLRLLAFPRLFLIARR